MTCAVLGTGLHVASLPSGARYVGWGGDPAGQFIKGSLRVGPAEQGPETCTVPSHSGHPQILALHPHPKPGAPGGGLVLPSSSVSGCWHRQLPAVMKKASQPEADPGHTLLAQGS